ncbi:MAG: class I SAM-dependent methyltransferase [Candidatus Glassbacteria bacterium]
MSEYLLYINKATGERLSREQLSFTESGLVTFLDKAQCFGEVSRGAWDSSYRSKFGTEQQAEDQKDIDKSIAPIMEKRMRSLPYFSHLLRFASSLNTESPILEVGCGTATTSLWLANEFGMVPYGVDFSEAAISEASRKFLANGLDPFTLSVTDVTSLPFENNTFPLVFGKTVFEHFDYPDLAAREIFRITAPGGFVVMDVPNSRNSFLRNATLRYLNQSYTIHTYTIEELSNFFEQANFQIIETWGSWLVYTTPAILLNEFLRFLKRSSGTAKEPSMAEDIKLSFSEAIRSRGIRPRTLIYPLILADSLFKRTLRLMNEFFDRMGWVTVNNGKLIGLVARKLSSHLKMP